MSEGFGDTEKFFIPVEEHRALEPEFYRPGPPSSPVRLLFCRCLTIYVLIVVTFLLTMLVAEQ